MRKPLSYALKVYVEVYIETEVTSLPHFHFWHSRRRHRLSNTLVCEPL